MIFTFTLERLEQLRELVRQECKSNTRPTIYSCLAALTWAHVTRARYTGEMIASERTRSRDAKLLIPIDWSRRCFKEETRNYFGNTSAALTTEVTIFEVLASCGDIKTLSGVVRKITNSIQSVSREWVEDRNALFAKIGDYRFLGLDHNPREPQELGFNTWRYFGADARWSILWRAYGPSRRSPSWPRAMGAAGALILPARADSQLYELLVTLPALLAGDITQRYSLDELGR